MQEIKASSYNKHVKMFKKRMNFDVKKKM